VPSLKKKSDNDDGSVHLTNPFTYLFISTDSHPHTRITTMYSFPSVGAIFSCPIPEKVTIPDHLPDSESLLEFDIDRKKSEIFEAVRERVRSKAQCE